jgi:hypothetical protein
LAGVHLLVGGLLLADGLVDKVLEIGDGLDVDLGDGARLGDLDDLAVQVVELCSVEWSAPILPYFPRIG